mgnify:CR=1 FL=1
MIIEVCAESYEYAEKAEKAGADRIELCRDLHLDGPVSYTHLTLPTKA